MVKGKHLSVTRITFAQERPDFCPLDLQHVWHLPPSWSEKLAVRIQHTLEITSKGLNKDVLQRTVDLLGEASIIQTYGLGASRSDTDKILRV